MARIGNETKLILKLALERVKAEQAREKTEMSRGPSSEDFGCGFIKGMQRCLAILDEIIAELEGGVL